MAYDIISPARFQTIRKLYEPGTLAEVGTTWLPPSADEGMRTTLGLLLRAAPVASGGAEMAAPSGPTADGVVPRAATHEPCGRCVLVELG